MAPHNLICGPNGSGKTTILEAVHILGTARSFRSGPPKSLIQHGEERFVVYGERSLSEGGQRPLGVQRAINGDVQLRISGETVQSVARLADELPLLLLNGDSFELLTGEPANRRRLLDWGVFHVEHEKRVHRSRFQRTLAQRNQLLRRDRIDTQELDVWTQDLARHGEAVSDAREDFFQSLQRALDPLIEELAPDIGKVQLAYRRGWDQSLSYREALKRGEASGRYSGHCRWLQCCGNLIPRSAKVVGGGIKVSPGGDSPGPQRTSALPD